MRLRTLGLLLAVLSLQACIWAPGQHMNKRQSSGEDAPNQAHYQLVPITPKLIAMDQASSQALATLPPILLAYRPAPYKIGAGDSLYITVWEHPELTSPAGTQQQTAANGRLVRPDGTLFYPYVGLLHAAGMTIEELRQALTEKLTQYVKQPQVDISIVAYGSQRVILSGAFAKPEPQLITVTPLTLQQAIGTAVVLSSQADISHLILSRDGQDYQIDLNALADMPKGVGDIYLKDGDHIYLPYNDKHEVYVVGEVMTPRTVTFTTTNLNLTQALGRAGGLNQTSANGKAVYVIRRAADTASASPATVYWLNAKSPAAFALASEFTVKPGDVVYVGPAGVTRWNRFISQLLPLSALISNTANAQNDFRR